MTNPATALSPATISTSPGYEARNANFKTVRNSFVSGRHPGLFLSPTLDTNVTDRNLGWVRYFTCWSADRNVDADGTARISVNTANERTLTQSLGITQNQARWIVENRTFATLGDLLAENSPTEPQAASGSALAARCQTWYDILDKVTVTNETVVPGRVNVNTAGRRTHHCRRRRRTGRPGHYRIPETSAPDLPHSAISKTSNP